VGSWIDRRFSTICFAYLLDWISILPTPLPFLNSDTLTTRPDASHRIFSVHHHRRLAFPALKSIFPCLMPHPTSILIRHHPHFASPRTSCTSCHFGIQDKQDRSGLLDHRTLHHQVKTISGIFWNPPEVPNCFIASESNTNEPKGTHTLRSVPTSHPPLPSNPPHAHARFPPPPHRQGRRMPLNERITIGVIVVHSLSDHHGLDHPSDDGRPWQILLTPPPGSDSQELLFLLASFPILSYLRITLN